MRIISRYIIKEFTIPFMYCFFAFLIIFIIGDLFENLDNFLFQKVPNTIVFKYYLLIIPYVFVLTTPLALLLAILYQLGYMSRHNELTALKASGVSFKSITIPFWQAGGVIALLLILFNETIVPHCLKEMSNIKKTYMENELNTKEGKLLKNAAYFSSLYNLSFYAETLEFKDKNIRAEKVSIKELDKKGVAVTELYGEYAIWKDKNWWLFNGYARNVADSAEGKSLLFFKKKEMDLNIPPDDLMRGQEDVKNVSDCMSSRELSMYIKRSFEKDNVPRALKIDLYRKWSLPITVLVVTLFGVTFGSKITRGGAMASIGISIFFYLLYYGISSFFIVMGKIGKVPPMLAVFIPQIAFFIGSFRLLKRTA